MRFQLVAPKEEKALLPRPHSTFEQQKGDADACGRATSLVALPLSATVKIGRHV